MTARLTVRPAHRPTPAQLPLHPARPVVSVVSPLLCVNQPEPTTPGSAPQSHESTPNPARGAYDSAEGRNRTAEAVLAVLVAFGPGCVVEQTSPGMRERVGVLAGAWGLNQ